MTATAERSYTHIDKSTEPVGPIAEWVSELPAHLGAQGVPEHSMHPLSRANGIPD